MKTKFRFLSILLVLLISLVVTVPVFAQSGGTTYTGDKIVLADTFRLESGDVLQGNLIVIGSTVSIAQTAKVNGDIVVLGGTVTSSGSVNGNLVVIGGALTLADNAVVDGNIVTTGATLKRSPLAQVTGNITEQAPTVFDIGNKDLIQFPFGSSRDYLTRFLMAALESLGLAVLAVIVGLFLPDQTKRVSDTIVNEPLVTGGVGLLTIFCAPIAMVLITLTIILIPITILAAIVLALAILYGWIAVGNEIGERIGRLFHAEWPVPVSSGIGVLLISLVVGALNLLPCLGWIFGFLVIILGLGAVVSSRFGSSKYADKVARAVLPSTPMPAAPVVPTAMETPSPEAKDKK
jgi:hypothetical protein